MSETACAECEQSVADVFCENCNAKFCRECFRDVHSRRALRSHVLIGVSSLDDVAVQCDVHQEPFKLFCKVEQVPVCSMCASIGAHACHDVILIEDAATAYREDIMACVRPLNDLAMKTRDRISSIGGCRDVLENCVKLARGEVDDACETVVKQIREFQANIHVIFDDIRKTEHELIDIQEKYHTSKVTKSEMTSDQLQILAGRTIEAIEIVQNWNELRDRVQLLVDDDFEDSYVADVTTFENNTSKSLSFPVQAYKDLSMSVESMLSGKWTELFTELNTLQHKSLGAITYELGWVFFEGRHSFKQSHEEAADWYELAAHLGSASGYNSLAFCCENGVGRDVSKQLSAKYYRKAALMGHPTAMWNLGLCHEFGKGVSKDLPTAVDWYLIAAAKDCEEAQTRLDEFQQNGITIPNEIPRHLLKLL